MTYVFDLRGTLVGNVGGLSAGECARLLRQLIAGGHRIIIWTGSSPDDIPGEFRELAHAITLKPSPPVDDYKRSVLVDDDHDLLRYWQRLGGYAIPAGNMCYWLHLNDQVEHEGMLPAPVSAGLTLTKESRRA